ncbi:MarR family winged helix-turn-helix transcriptional regulator [Massilia horti]|uniref:MarR family transcriptional regulator n=1 Tax=Massilia horti TaxID=2562153 RepID=A0A4Y9T4B2_9BURK|nr:MarR family transcriptional regulator [Massilia horti]TFW31901.1 MarR family transcriptional regulator [Massilia horti]
MFDECIYFNTAALARRLEREWAQAFSPFGVTPPQGFMLRAILDRPGMLQYELADALSISRPTVTRALDGLVQRGYVERRRTDADGREVAIHPTAAAVAIKAALNQSARTVTGRLKAQMGDAAFAEVVQKIRKTRSTLE